ncbi:MAG: discoidin domain-containing protein, partial [Bacteroidota bacterium]
RGNVINLGAGNYSYPLAFEVTQGGKVYNNTFVGVQYAAFLGWLHANPPLISNPKNNSMDMSNNEFYNNIFYGTVIVGIAKGVTYTYRNGTKATITHDEIWDDNYFSNNIFYTPYDTKKIRVFYYSGTITYNASVAPYGRYSSNLSQTELNITESNFATQWEGRANITNDMYANPQFVNGTWNSATNYGDYRLQSSSPALASGRIIPEWKYDMDNKLIPQGIAPDRGAYQKNTSGGVADIIKPELKTATAKDAQTIILTFSEALDKASAENAGNYTIGSSVQVMQASLSSAGTQVTLMTSQHEAGMTYTVAANNIKDLAGNVIASQSNFATYTVKQTTVDNSHKLVIQTASGSAAPDLPVHGPEKAIDGKCAQDGDPDSRWAAEQMPQHITFDLGSMQNISKTRFSFFKWNEGRIYRYSIQVSADNTNWKEVVAEASSIQEEWTENIFDEQQARYVRLQFIDSNHSTPEWTGYAGLWEAEVWGKTGQTTGTEEKNDMLPKEFSLEQNYPNPFNPSTKISFSLPVASNVKLTIFNSIGEVVRELTNNHFEAGSHQMEFNASGLASGIYLYRIETASFTQTKKMMLMK